MDVRVCISATPVIIFAIAFFFSNILEIFLYAVTLRN